MALPCRHQLGLLQPSRPRLENVASKVFTPHSQSPTRDVLRHLPAGVGDAAALFLGCADGSCLLASLAVEHPGLRNLTTVLDDNNPIMLARAALILLMCAELNPNCRDDMVVLWEVWYCSTWGAGTWPCVKPFVERLVQGSVPWLVIPDPQDEQALRGIWKRWLSKDNPSANKLLAWREDFKATMLQSSSAYWGQQRQEHLGNVMYMTVKMDSIEIAERTLRKVASDGQVNNLQKVLQQDLQAWYDTGNMVPNFRGQQASNKRAANVTLVNLKGNAWPCNIFSSPALCWGPFSAAELESAFRSGDPPGVTARVCLDRITSAVRGMQQHTQLGKAPATSQGQLSSERTCVKVQLVCMDANLLCLGMPLTGGSSSGGVQAEHTQQKGKKACKASRKASSTPAMPPPLQFDCIDTSTIADDSSLLPLLVAAGARLHKVPHARLYTSLRIWTHGSVLKRALPSSILCMPLTLTPTILGLRLLTDLARDRPETVDAQEYTYRVDQFRELVWAPVPVEMQAQPQPELAAQLLGGSEGSIEAALQSVATELCCSMDIGDGCNPKGCTPQLLAWLLASLSQQVDMSAVLGDLTGNEVGSSSSSSHNSGSAPADVKGRYTATHRLLWALRSKVTPLLPAHFRLCFTSGVDILRSSLQQNAPQDWQPADVPRCKGLDEVQMVWLFKPKGGFQGVRPVLVQTASLMPWDGSSSGTQPKEPVTVDTKTDAWALHGAAPVPEGAHIVEVWMPKPVAVCKPYGVPTLSVYLPLDHGLALDRAYGMVAGAGSVRSPLKPRGTVQAPATLAQVLLPAACPNVAAQRADRHAAKQQSSKPWELRVVYAHESADSHIVFLQLVSTATGKVPSPSDAITPECMSTYWIQVGHQVLGDAPHLPASDRRQFPTAHSMLVGLTKPEDQAWERWPNDEAWKMAPERLHLAQLSPLPEAAAKSLMQRCSVSAVEDHAGLLGYAADAAGLYEDGEQSPGEGSAAGVVLDAVIGAVSPARLPPCPRAPICWTVCGWLEDESGGMLGRSSANGAVTLCLRLHPPLLVTKAGRPVLPVTVVDLCECEDAVDQGVMSQTELDTVLQRLGITAETLTLHESEQQLGVFKSDGGAQWKNHCLTNECQTLRRMLFRKSTACHPTADQQACLPHGNCVPYYYNSYMPYMQCPGAGYCKSDPDAMKQLTAEHSRVLHRVMELLEESSQRGLSRHEHLAMAQEMQQLLACSAARGPLPPKLLHYQHLADTVIAKLQLSAE